MFEKLKDGIVSRAERKQLQKMEEEKARLEEQQAQAEARELQIKEELEAMENEKQRLLEMSKEERMVELIFAIRGFHQEFNNLMEGHDYLLSKMNDIEGELEKIKSDIDYMETQISMSSLDD